MKLAMIAALALAGTVGLLAQGRVGSVIQTPPRIASLADSQLTDAGRMILRNYAVSGPDRIRISTLLHHPDLAESLLAVEWYFAAQSELPSRDREILILRTAWLTQSQRIWAEHVRTAARLRFPVLDAAGIAGPAASGGWEPFELSLLRAADELHAHASLTDATWRELAARYNQHQMMDAVFTVAAFTAIGTIDNALDVRYVCAECGGPRLPPAAQVPVRPREATLTVARVAPLEPADWTPEIRKMLDPTGAGRNVIAVYRTFARHPQLYVPRQMLSEHIRLKNTLTPAQRELLILRMGWLAQSEYEWAQHVRTGRSAGLDTARITRGPDAPGWTPVEAALLRAADDMYRSDTVTGLVWPALADTFNTQQLLDVLATAAGYRMVSTVLNAFGVQPEPGNERFPQ